MSRRWQTFSRTENSSSEGFQRSSVSLKFSENCRTTCGVSSRNSTMFAISSSVIALNFVAVGERFVHRHLVNIFQVAPDRHPHRYARHAHAERLKKTADVVGRRLAFSVRVCSKDNFAHLYAFIIFWFKARQQVRKVKVVRANAAN